MKLSDLVTTYITIRDARAVRKAAFTAADAKDKATQEKIEAVFLMKFKELGIDSVKASDGVGTAYKSTLTSATVADRGAFLQHIVTTGEYTLLDVRANKTAVTEWREANNDLPPGLNWREEQTISVRRS